MTKIEKAFKEYLKWLETFPSCTVGETYKKLEECYDKYGVPENKRPLMTITLNGKPVDENTKLRDIQQIH